MRHLLPILFATVVALGASVPARADFAEAQAAFELGDYQTAYAEFLKLAQAGDSNAQTALGVLYDDGHGVAKDQHIAVMWYQKAAEKGNPQAQLNLGIHYEQGQGIEQDNALALGWYRKAAEQGYTPAQVALGSMYYRGRGVPEDKRKPTRGLKKQPTKATPRHSRIWRMRSTSGTEPRSTIRRRSSCTSRLRRKVLVIRSTTWV